jgi:hypothetical protein
MTTFSLTKSGHFYLQKFTNKDSFTTTKAFDLIDEKHHKP